MRFPHHQRSANEKKVRKTHPTPLPQVIIRDIRNFAPSLFPLLLRGQEGDEILHGGEVINLSPGALGFPQDL